MPLIIKQLLRTMSAQDHMYSEVSKRHQISLLTNTKYGQNLNSVSEMNNVENIFVG